MSNKTYMGYYFKFQSDSINPFLTSKRKPVANQPLNSNLILLIRPAEDDWTVGRSNFKFQSDSINPDPCEKGEYRIISFKFQSDSINPLFRRKCKHCNKSLNSNLILLILIAGVDADNPYLALNSNLILLIQRSTKNHFPPQIL